MLSCGAPSSYIGFVINISHNEQWAWLFDDFKSKFQLNVFVIEAHTRLNDCKLNISI